MGPRGSVPFATVDPVLDGAGVPGLDVTEFVAGFTLPALIVHSTDDREVPVAASRRLARRGGGAERVRSRASGTGDSSGIRQW
jgi:hypothetical protein